MIAGISCKQPETPVSQEGSITLASSADILFPETGGSSQVAFSATGNWTAQASASWLSVEPEAGKAGETLSVTVSASANKTTGILTAQLTLACGNDRKSINVTQSEPIELPETPVTWPSDADALDAGLDFGETREIKFSSEEFAKFGINKEARDITAPVTIDGFTFGGPGLAYYDNRITTHKVNKQWSAEYPDVIPSQCYFSFKTTVPGPSVSSSPSDPL